MEELQWYTKCEKCWCYYKWKHDCDWLMLLLVEFFKKKNAIITPEEDSIKLD